MTQPYYADETVTLYHGNVGELLADEYCEVIAKRLSQGVLDFGDAS